MCHAIHRYEKANKNYMKDYGSNKESSYVMYSDSNNLYKQTMLQNSPIDDFKCRKGFV